MSLYLERFRVLHCLKIKIVIKYIYRITVQKTIQCLYCCEFSLLSV